LAEKGELDELKLLLPSLQEEFTAACGALETFLEEVGE
jgi:hypothetical protein